MLRALALVALLLPGSALAASQPPPTFAASRDLLISTSSPGNVYVAGGTVTVSAPIEADLTAAAGTLDLDAPVAGDALLTSVFETVRAPIGGAMRTLAGRAVIAAPVKGDEVAVAGSFLDTSGSARDAFVLAGSASFKNGLEGPVTIYANSVSLAGVFDGDVHIEASGRVALAPGTVIKGELTYQAPEEASVPKDVSVSGGIHYAGASYLPSQEQRAIDLASIGVFLIVKILGALILAGLFAGLFPRLADGIAEEVFDSGARRVLLTILLGFAIMVTTPFLFILLAITFVGIGIALVLAVLYVLLALLAFIYAGVLLGAWLARQVAKRETVLWRDAVIGMLVLMLLTIIPYVGMLFLFLLILTAEGALARIAYRFAFPKDSETSALLL